MSGIWYVLPSASPGSFKATQWGQASDMPVPGDYDGDGKADIGVWQPHSGMWYILPSGTPGTYIGTQWGTSTDLPAVGDFDGDGSVDLAVFRPSTGAWYILSSAAPGTCIVVQWGLAADVPVSALMGILRTTVGQAVSAVTVIPTAANLDALGATVQLVASARNADGHLIAGKTFTWVSSDVSVATVSSSGLVTARANGSAGIKATASGIEGTAAVTVAQKAATLAVSPAGAAVSGVGATRQFTVEARDAGGSLIPGPRVHPAWMSLNSNVAAINTLTGLATAVGNGQVTIRVEVDGVVAYGLLWD